jgi:hypothetical protein
MTNRNAFPLAYAYPRADTWRVMCAYADQPETDVPLFAMATTPAGRPLEFPDKETAELSAQDFARAYLLAHPERM